MGIDHARWSLNGQSFELDDDFAENVSEEALRQMMQNLTTGTGGGEVSTSSEENSGLDATTWTQTPPPSPSPAPPPSPPFVLPDFEDVELTVATPSGEQVLGPGTSAGGTGGYSSGWRPRTPSEVERDREVGRRGEELVYRMEIERVREMGHGNPEQLARIMREGWRM
jgi:hypothetical protein